MKPRPSETTETEKAMRAKQPVAPFVCPHCGQSGKPATETPGSFVMEVVLWLLLLVPGIIYSFWRTTSKRRVCPACRQPGMIPSDSPRGRQILDSFDR